MSGVGDGYTPITGAGGGGQSSQGSGRGNPLYYTQTPRDYVSSLIVAQTTPGDSSWVALSSAQGPNYIELTEILLYSIQNTACTFGMAVVPTDNVPDFITAAGNTLNQPYVVFVQQVPKGFEVTIDNDTIYTGGSIRVALSTAVYQNEELLIWSDGFVNYRISGKVVTQ